MASPAKRMKYDASFKLRVVAFAMSSNNSAAARKYGVSEKLVRDWKKSEASLKKMPKEKCSARSGTCYWPELENYLEGWVNEIRENGYTVSRNGIRTQALKWAKTHPGESKDFKATPNWCSRFMKRKNLTKNLFWRQKTKSAQPAGGMELPQKNMMEHFFRILGTSRPQPEEDKVNLEDSAVAVNSAEQCGKKGGEDVMDTMALIKCEEQDVWVKKETMEEDDASLDTFSLSSLLNSEIQSAKMEGVDHCMEPLEDPLKVKQEPIQDLYVTPTTGSSSLQLTSALDSMSNGEEESTQKHINHQSNGSEGTPALQHTQNYEAGRRGSLASHKTLRSPRLKDMKMLDQKIAVLEAQLAFYREKRAKLY